MKLKKKKLFIAIFILIITMGINQTLALEDSYNVKWTVADTIPPYFTNSTPYNITIPFNNEISQNVNATDDEGNFDSFAVNDTRFTINSSGYLKNNTILGVGEYYVNITINDTLNNLNSSVILINITILDNNVDLYINNSRSNFSAFNNTVTGRNGIWLNATSGELDTYQLGANSSEKILDYTPSELSSHKYNMTWIDIGTGQGFNNDDARFGCRARVIHSIWVNMSGTLNGNQMIVGTSGYDGIFLSNETTIYARCWNSSGVFMNVTYQSPVPLNDSQWHHYVYYNNGSYGNGGDLRLFIDGVEVANKTDYNSGWEGFGDSNSGYAYHFYMIGHLSEQQVLLQFDEARRYAGGYRWIPDFFSNKMPEPSDIISFYNSGRFANNSLISDGLSHWYPINENTGTILYDLTGKDTFDDADEGLTNFEDYSTGKSWKNDNIKISLIENTDYTLNDNEFKVINYDLSYSYLPINYTYSPTVNVELWVNGTLWNNGTSPQVNDTELPTGFYNVTARIVGNQNISGDIETWWVNVSQYVIPPEISIETIYPTMNINATLGRFFNVSFNITCLNGTCGTVNVSLDPTIIMQDVDIDNLKDTYVDSSLPTANNGGLSYAILGETATASFYYYVSFNLSSIPNNTSIANGDLCLYAYNYYGESSDNYSVYELINDTWNESMNYNTKVPSSNIYNEIDVYNGTGADKFICFNVTSWIINRTNESKTNADFFLNKSKIDGDDDRVYIRTGEHTANLTQRPYLSVHYDYENTIKIGLIPIESDWESDFHPFYTNATNNPITTSSLNKGQSEIVTFWVNATGDLGNYTFFAYVNLTDDLSVSNITDDWNVTIITVDSNNPTVNIIYPTSTNYSDNTLDLDYTSSDETGLDSCWYNNGSENSSAQSPSTNWSSQITQEGSNTWVVYCNDTSNNEGSDSVTFIVDTTPPYFTVFANQTIYLGQSLNYNINAVDDGVGLDSFSIDDTTNFSINQATGVLTNISALISMTYNINVSINDTLGNLNSSILGVTVSPTPEPISVISHIYPSVDTQVPHMIIGEKLIFNIQGVFKQWQSIAIPLLH